MIKSEQNFNISVKLKVIRMKAIFNMEGQILLSFFHFAHSPLLQYYMLYTHAQTDTHHERSKHLLASRSVFCSNNPTQYHFVLIGKVT